MQTSNVSISPIHVADHNGTSICLCGSCIKHPQCVGAPLKYGKYPKDVRWNSQWCMKPKTLKLVYNVGEIYKLSADGIFSLDTFKSNASNVSMLVPSCGATRPSAEAARWCSYRLGLDLYAHLALCEWGRLQLFVIRHKFVPIWHESIYGRTARNTIAQTIYM